MENSYGIGIANRYDLFYMDDDEQDPFEQLKQKKQKNAKQQKAATTTITPTGQVINTNVGQAKATNVNNNNNNSNKTAEKENKISASNRSNQNNEQKTGTGQGGKGGNQNAQRSKGIKETQNLKTQDNRGPREDKDKNANQNRTFDRAQNKEERNNRRNRDGGDRQANGPIGEFNNREDRPRRQGGGQRDSEGGGNRRFDRRGKREFDRQSGSDKTGVKAVDKRDGGGAHNWGSHKQDLDDLAKGTDYLTDGEKNDSNVEEVRDGEPGGEETKPVEEEMKEMTLDEWKAQRAANRAKPKYNLRKAGEGEDTTQWTQMVPLGKKKDVEESEESDIDPNNQNQRGAGREKKQVLDIEFHFTDSRRTGGLGRQRRGGGNRQGGGGNTGGQGGNRNRNRTERGERGERGDRRDDKMIDRRGPTAPKVDDEHDFPSLG